VREDDRDPGRSRHVWLVEPVASDPRRRRPGADAPDYVLLGELEEFAGSQCHSFLVTPFRVGFVRDRWGAPEGRVSVQFELFSRDGRVWRGRVATRQESAQGGLADAVLEALALNDEALAARLDVSSARAPACRACRGARARRLRA
jgi:hypothetical protein